MYLKYLDYVLRHKWYVMVECFKQGLIWRGLVHDMSKFRLDEFIPYAKYFYGEHGIRFNGGFFWEHKRNEEIKKQFDYAWLLHQKRNQHHWQWWLLSEDDGGTKILEMSLKYKIEMLCDWRGAGMAINGKDNIREWYEKNKGNMNLHKFTRTWVEVMV